MNQNKLIVAAAGAGKTTFLVNEALKIKDERVLITTYTQANEAEIRKKIIGDDEVITCRPADLLKPILMEERDKMKEYLEEDEDVLSYILFPQVAIEYFKLRQTEKYNFDASIVNKEERVYPV